MTDPPDPRCPLVEQALCALMAHSPDAPVLRRPDGSPVTAGEMIRLVRASAPEAHELIQMIHGAALRMIGGSPPACTLLERFGAPPELKDWARQNRLSLARAWIVCERGDWSAWILARSDLPEERVAGLVLAWECADRAERHARASRGQAEVWAADARSWTAETAVWVSRAGSPPRDEVDRIRAADSAQHAVMNAARAAGAAAGVTTRHVVRTARARELLWAARRARALCPAPQIVCGGEKGST